LLTLVFLVHRVAPTVPALAPAKVLRSETVVPTRRCTSRAPQAAASAAATGELLRGTIVATGPQRGTAAVAVATTATAAATSASPVLAITTGDRGAVVEIPDEDAPPPGGANG
jgi:hypothetical protein